MIYLPSDVLGYTFLQMYESDVVICRAVCRTFKNLIDEEKPYAAAEHYFKAKEVHEKFLTLFENDSVLSTQQDSMTDMKKDYEQEKKSTSWWRRSFCRPSQMMENLSFTTTYLKLEMKQRREKINEEYDKRAILCYKTLQKCPLIRQTITDIFGSMRAFEKLPILDRKNKLSIDFPVSDKHVSQPVMRGIDKKGQIFFTLRAISTSNPEKVETQMFYYDPKFRRGEWINVGGGIIHTRDADVTPKDIATIKTFIEKKGNEEWTQ